MKKQHLHMVPSKRSWLACRLQSISMDIELGFTYNQEGDGKSG